MGYIFFEGSVFLVNLDPAAEYLPYTPDLDIRDLVNFKQLCEQCDCGPNGALLTCFRLLEDNFSWLTEGLQKSAGEFRLQQTQCLMEN